MKKTSDLARRWFQARGQMEALQKQLDAASQECRSAHEELRLWLFNHHYSQVVIVDGLGLRLDNNHSVAVHPIGKDHEEHDPEEGTIPDRLDAGAAEGAAEETAF